VTFGPDPIPRIHVTLFPGGAGPTVSVGRGNAAIQLPAHDCHKVSRRDVSPSAMFVSAICACYAEALGEVLGIEHLPWSALEVEANSVSVVDPVGPHLDNISVHPTIFGGDPSMGSRYRSVVRQARDRNLASRAIRGNVAYKVGEATVVAPGCGDPVVRPEVARVGSPENSVSNVADTSATHCLSCFGLYQSDGAFPTLHPDCCFEDIALGRVFHGRATVLDYCESWRDALCMTATCVNRRRDPDILVVEADCAGNHSGNFRGLAPTLRPVNLRIATVATIYSGLIVNARIYYDTWSLLRQLGASLSCGAHSVGSCNDE
jgi:organic hydroperoxide reductase OsmC/OhrA